MTMTEITVGSEPLRSMRERGPLWLAAPLAIFFFFQNADGQDRLSGAQMRHLGGLSVWPAFEGWTENEDGSFELFFGYMNSNWEQEFDIPVSRDNYFAFTEPGGLDDLDVEAYDPSVADQGQPTHLYPRRSPFLFTIRVPEDFGETELVWTVATNGSTNRAYGSLSSEYAVDPHVISTEVAGAGGSLSDRLRDNKPPELEVEGDGHRTARVGERLTLVAYAYDPDQYPSSGGGGAVLITPEEAREDPERVWASAPGWGVGAGGVSSQAGLRLSWMVYRGLANHVTFDPVPMKTWIDQRPFANSPWSVPRPPLPEVPPDNKWVFHVTFDEPGEYQLRAVASDSALFAYANVTVTVTPRGR